ncbi:MAG TPA: hypothetical protein DDY98_07665 [Ruminococcaceae bacterium]|nr:hypothetical protein [Oscillospiraceae bacterium]
MLLLFRSHSASGTVAVISVAGEEVQRIDLTKVTASYDIVLDSSPAVTLTVEPNAVFFSSAQCRDKLCVKAGKLTKANDTAVCLPAKVTIRLIGEKTKSGVDAIAY